MPFDIGNFYDAPVVEVPPRVEPATRPKLWTRIRRHVWGPSYAEVFSEAADLICEPSRWCRGVLARDAGGLQLDDPRDVRAASWCAVGAIQKVAESRLSYCDKRVKWAERRGLRLDTINDRGPHEKTVSILRHLSVMARAEGR